MIINLRVIEPVPLNFSAIFMTKPTHPRPGDVWFEMAADVVWTWTGVKWIQVMTA